MAKGSQLASHLVALITKRKVLLIGWDAADWEHITPLLEEGLMPTLDALINRGVMGNLATLAANPFADAMELGSYWKTWPINTASTVSSSLTR